MEVEKPDLSETNCDIKVTEHSIPEPTQTMDLQQPKPEDGAEEAEDEEVEEDNEEDEDVKDEEEEEEKEKDEKDGEKVEPKEEEKN